MKTFFRDNADVVEVNNESVPVVNKINDVAESCLNELGLQKGAIVFSEEVVPTSSSEKAGKNEGVVSNTFDRKGNDVLKTREEEEEEEQSIISAGKSEGGGS